MARRKGPRQQRAEAQHPAMKMLDNAARIMMTADPEVESVDIYGGHAGPLGSEESSPPVFMGSVQKPEEEWEAELPPPTEEDIEAATAHSLTIAVAGDTELDNLWDWVRGDVDRGAAFFGFTPQTSKEMRVWAEALGTNLIALYDDIGAGPEHVGFVSLTYGPLGQAVAVVGLYLSTQARGSLRRLAPQFFALASEACPEVTQFIIQTDDPARARLYAGLGLKHHHMLVWEPPVTVTPQEGTWEPQPPEVGH